LAYLYHALRVGSFDVKTLQDISGHADASTTIHHDARKRQDILQDAGDKMDTVFLEIG
jgi:hypothetical protein